MDKLFENSKVPENSKLDHQNQSGQAPDVVGATTCA